MGPKPAPRAMLEAPPGVVGPGIGDALHVVVDVNALALAAGAEVVVTTHQALESSAVDGTVAAVALDPRMERAL